MERIRDEDLNTADYWNEVYEQEHPTTKRRLDDERLTLLQGFMRRMQDATGRIPKFLDVGCGFGEALRYLHWRVPGAQLDGIDIADRAVDLANEDKRCLNYHVGSAYKLPFPDSSRDIVWIGETLEHLENPEKAVAEAVRVLRSGGYLIVSLPYKMANDSDEHLHMATFEDVVRWADRFGRIRYVDVVASGLSIFGVIEVTK